MATKEEIMKFMVFVIFLAVACIVSACCAKYSPFVKNDKLPYILSIIGFSIMIVILHLLDDCRKKALASGNWSVCAQDFYTDMEILMRKTI